MVRTLEFEVTDAELHAALGEFERRHRSELDYRAFLSLLGRLRRTSDVVREADLKQLLQLFEEDSNPGYVRKCTFLYCVCPDIA
jgi:Ca2+-binding EF-hand superfamily protein